MFVSGKNEVLFNSASTKKKVSFYLTCVLTPTSRRVISTSLWWVEQFLNGLVIDDDVSEVVLFVVALSLLLLYVAVIVVFGNCNLRAFKDICLVRLFSFLFLFYNLFLLIWVFGRMTNPLSCVLCSVYLPIKCVMDIGAFVFSLVKALETTTATWNVFSLTRFLGVSR